MIGYTVEVRTAIGTGGHILHAWLHVTKPDGTTEAWGFYPETDSLGNIINGPGDIRSEDPGAPYTSTSGPMSMTELQYQALVGNIAAMDAAPPNYSLISLPGSMQCSMWVLNALQDINLIPATISPDITPEFIPLLDSLIWNPITQSYGFLIYDLVNDLFSDASSWIYRGDPLALDLDGDGIETIGADGSVLFDHNGNGIRTGTGWVKGDDGFLVLDRIGNGTIDGGAELFGTNTVLADGSEAADGFAALADLDTNADGVFDANDAQFTEVRVWRDLNQDGVSQANELLSLTDSGIASIGLDATTTNTAFGNGNTQAETGSFTRLDGTTGTAANLDLADNPFYRQFTDSVPLTDAAMALPNMRCSGSVRDLREAANVALRERAA